MSPTAASPRVRLRIEIWLRSSYCSVPLFVSGEVGKTSLAAIVIGCISIALGGTSLARRVRGGFTAVCVLPERFARATCAIFAAALSGGLDAAGLVPFEAFFFTVRARVAACVAFTLRFSSLRIAAAFFRARLAMRLASLCSLRARLSCSFASRNRCFAASRLRLRAVLVRLWCRALFRFSIPCVNSYPSAVPHTSLARSVARTL